MAEVCKLANLLVETSDVDFKMQSQGTKSLNEHSPDSGSNYDCSASTCSCSCTAGLA